MPNPILYKAVAAFGDGDENKYINASAPANQQPYWFENATATQTIDNSNIGTALRGLNSPHEELFVWGTSKWGDVSQFPADNKQLRGTMSSAMSELTVDGAANDYRLKTPFKIQIDASETPTETFTIYFDRTFGIYGTRIKVTDKTTGVTTEYTNASAYFTYRQSLPFTSYEVEITHINVGGYPLVIVAVLTGLSMDFMTNYNARSIEFEQRNSFDALIPDEWQVVTQTGQMSIEDIDGQIAYLRRARLLQNQQKIRIQSTDANGEWSDVAHYFGTFDINSMAGGIVPCAFTSEVEKWQSVLLYDRILTNDTSLYDLLMEQDSAIRANSENKGLVISPKAEAFLKLINVRFCYLEGGDLFSRLNKILYVGMCVLTATLTSFYVDLYDYRRFDSDSTVYRIEKGQMSGAVKSTFGDYIDGVSWEENIVSERRTEDFGASMMNITYGNGLFVAVGQSPDSVLRSTDGFLFAAGTLPTGIKDWNSIAYGNGKFVIVGINSATAYSEDGITFTAGTIPSGTWYNVAYGNGLFVAVSANSIAYSEDGITFTVGTTPSGFWNNVTYGDGKFVIIGLNSVAYSEDGKTFMAGTIPSGFWYGLAYGNGKFVSVGVDVVAYSTDGITFSYGTLPVGSIDLRNIVYGEGKFVAVGRYNTTVYSEDGVNFNLGTLPRSPLRNWYGIIYERGIFVAVGSTNAFSINGVDFTDKLPEVRTQARDMGVPPFYSLTINELMQTDTTINSVPIGRHIAQKLIDNEDGKEVAEFEIDRVTLYAYDRAGNKLTTKIDAANGEFLKVGDFIELWDTQRKKPLSWYDDGRIKVFEVRNVKATKTGRAIKFRIIAKEV